MVHWQVVLQLVMLIIIAIKEVLIFYRKPFSFSSKPWSLTQWHFSHSQYILSMYVIVMSWTQYKFCTTHTVMYISVSYTAMAQSYGVCMYTTGAANLPNMMEIQYTGIVILATFLCFVWVYQVQLSNAASSEVKHNNYYIYCWWWLLMWASEQSAR